MDWFASWDSAWYLDIAKHGYHYLPGEQSSVSFFSLYPLLVRVVAGISHNLRLAGHLVSNASLFLGCVVLWKMARRDYRQAAVGEQAVLFLLFNPVSFFFSTMYSESLFFCLMISAIYFAGARRWWLAALCAYFAALTRHVGLLLIAPLALECASQIYRRRASSFHGGGDWRKGWLASVDRPGASWGRALTSPWDAFTNLNTQNLPLFYKERFFSAVGLALLLIVLGACLRLRPSHLVICPMYLLLYTSTSLREAIPRYLSVLFPFYLVLGIIASRLPKLQPMMFAASTDLLTIATILFVNNYWFT